MTPIKTTPKDFFLNLGVIVTLYVSLISILNLVFSIINKVFPDVLSYGFDLSQYTVRWTISSLIILYPLFAYLSHLVNKDIVSNPEKKNIGIKKWSTYLTLFLTGATIAVDLIILVNTFLGGEITTRFVMKVLVVLIVTGFVFSYYLYDLRRTVIANDSKLKMFSYIAALLVIASIIGGFFAVGSPFNERLRKFDDTRTQDLSSIQSQVINYWQKKGALPASLTDLNDPLASFTVPQDPETKAMYEYKATSQTNFELCATFSLPSDQSVTRPAYGPYGADSFVHSEGRTCFERNIDPSLYPPVKN